MHPGFTADLCETIRDQKLARVPDDNKINIGDDIRQFLTGSTNPGIYADEKAGLKLKASRKWATTRQTRPYILNFKIPARPPVKEGIKQISGNKFDVEFTPAKR